jgi:DNA repair exonuclease SbcCD ATPase subunit
MEAVEKFETGSAEGVIRLYKSLVDDRDEMVRAKAQARLARLIEDDKKTTAAKAPVDDARTIAELRGASERVAAIRTSFDEAAAELEKLAEQVDQKTRRPAKDEDEVEEVERLIERIEKSLARAKKIRGEFRDAVSKAEILGAGLTGDEGKKLIAEVEAVAVEVGTRIGDAIRAADRAAGKAEKYAKDETADAGLYLTSAQTALATGNLSAARRDLRKAEQLFRSQGKAPADLHFAYGELHAKLARGASSDADKRKNLQRAIASFKRFAAAGRGFKVERAREQIARLEADLAKLP